MTDDAQPPVRRPPPCRPYHLTPEQLWRAYHEAPMNQFLARCAQTRLAMLRKEQKREAVSKEFFDATC